VYEEAYHRILAKCHDVLSKIKKEKENLSCEMKGLLFKYLKSTPSDRKNSTRNEAGAYIQMRKMKEKIREMIAALFYPGVNVHCGYKVGQTYIEKIYKQAKLKAVFSDATPPDTCKLLNVFILLHNIYVPDNIGSFTKMLRNSYKKMHVEASTAHNISHTELWNSDAVLLDMNLFILETIAIMKDKETIVILRDINKDCEELLLPDYLSSSDDDAETNELQDDNDRTELTKKCNKHENIQKEQYISLFHQKISHCCQQYAFFVALTIANMIGLYPIIPGCSWRAAVGQDKEQIGRYNIFAVMLHLLYLQSNTRKKTKSNSDEEEQHGGNADRGNDDDESDDGSGGTGNS
jgi:hypothetical protein